MSTDDGLIEALRARRTKGYESISRDAMQDGRLSMKARGILAYLLSKPDNWRTNAKAIASECDRDGREAIANGLKELEELGYLARRRRRAARGRWVWSWVYGDDPSEVRHTVDSLDVQSADASDSNVSPGQTIDGKPVHGEAVPAVRTMDGFAAHGQSGDGSSAHGKPVHIEIKDQEKDPPTPRGAGGDHSNRQHPQPSESAPAVHRRCVHGKTSCRDCGTSARSRQWAARDRAATELEASERLGRECPMCVADGPASQHPGTRWLRVMPGTQLPVTPYLQCDHTTPHVAALEKVAAAEAAAEAARSRAASPSHTEVGRTGQSSGREQVRAILASRVRSGPSRGTYERASRGAGEWSARPEHHRGDADASLARGEAS